MAEIKKKRRPIAYEETNRPGINAKIHITKRGQEKKLVRVELTDKYNNPLGISASVTLGNAAEERSAIETAKIDALRKLDQKLNAKRIQENNGHFFSDALAGLSEEERLRCVGDGHKKESSRRDVLRYCTNKMYLLDKFGPTITSAQCQEVADCIYAEILENKRFTAVSREKDDVSEIHKFFEAVEETINSRGKKAYGKDFSETDFSANLAEIKERVMAEDRLRALLENYLQQQDVEDTANTFCEKIAADIRLVRSLGSKKDYEKSISKTIFYLRELSGNEEQSKNQANVHIRDLNDLIQNMAVYCKEEIPLFALPLYPVEQAIQIEHVKELEWEVQVRYVCQLLKIAGQSAYALGGAIMLICGPRLAELCAVKFKDVVIRDDNYAILVINYTTDGRTRTDEGKNLSFHRTIIITKLGVDMLMQRKAYLSQRLGYSDQDIEEAYIVSRSNDEISCPMAPSAFSRLLKKELQTAGCGDNYWDEVRVAMELEPDFDRFNQPETSEAAYVLRRTATSNMCNVARMDPFQVDALLGHKLPRNCIPWDKKNANADEWPKIARMMERIVYHTDHTANPFFEAVSVTKEKPLKLMTAYNGMSVKIPRKTKVVFHVESTGDAAIVLPRSCTFVNQGVRELDADTTRDMVLPLHSRQEYEEIQNQYK